MDWRTRHTALLDRLEADRVLAADWRPAFEATPRHRFVPRQVWRAPFTGCEPVDRDREPDAWWSLVYGDESVVTQLDDGADGGPGRPTSSSSMPSLVARMLDLLAVPEGGTVLEIGTGTGYNAALLARRLGAERVVTVEVDPAVAGRARRALARAGVRPLVVTGDGAHGYPAGAPYDRVIATCGVREIPYAWVKQTRPGGIVVAPCHRPFWSGALVALRVADDGTTSGRFGVSAQFMPLRSQRPGPDAPVDTASGRTRGSDLRPQCLPALGLAAWADACLPGVTMVGRQTGGTYEAWLYDGLGSGATAAAGPEGPVEVWEYGPRDLWAEMERTYAEYLAAGAPESGDFGLTVTPDGQRLWLHSPDHRPSAGERRGRAA